MAARTARAWLLALALLPAGARAGSASVSLSVGATVVRGDEKARPWASPATARPPAPPAGGTVASGHLPPPGSLRLTGVGEARSTEAPAR